MIKLLDQLKEQRLANLIEQFKQNFMRQEAAIGGQLFGPLPEGTKRQFFCLDSHTWIWHEEWLDQKTKQSHAATTRYEVRPNGILKTQDGQGHRYIDTKEELNFYWAVQSYFKRVSAEVYGLTA